MPLDDGLLDDGGCGLDGGPCGLNDGCCGLNGGRGRVPGFGHPNDGTCCVPVFPPVDG